MKLKLIVGLLFATSVYAAPKVPAPMDILNTNSNNLGTAYTDTESNVLSGLGGAQNFSVFNGSTLGSIVLSFGTDGLTCDGSSVDHYLIPSETGLLVENVAINKVICLRSQTGSSITSGTISTSVW